MSVQHSQKSKKVTILQYRLFHYRMDLFNHLKRLAEDRGIDLHLVVGQPFGAEKLKKDEGVLPWAEKVENIYFPIKEKKDLCWQPLPSALKDSDLIVFMQENRLLSNYWWMLKRRLGGPLVAFWGHGRDYQSRAPGGFRERWKQWSINQVDWWFAYTSMTCQHIAEAGFPAARTTCLNNAIDVSGLRRDWASVSDETKARIRKECKIDNDSVVGLFCGSLYPDKKLDLLVDACDLIHAQLPNFRLVVIGDGSSRPELEQAFASRPWATWVGVKRGVEKAAYFGMASIVLNPGLVGLHILDAFAMGAPMLTTSTALHSPEIAYLVDGVNGMMTDDSPRAYADAALAILSDPEKLAVMSKAANETAEKYTVENMAANFIDGIEQALKLKGRV